ncbi:biotin transporter BioY [Paenibacillus nasutitermitis]|uniref:Biotin transporter n=1 Tax=Paenibacillus nasutitermitis TaxID=1652958 RepID=A0A916YY20_9BACL|nr:biotin transporter BioY [Paenibacillus nasutitermitis]GGD66771.1 biotin transporter BioY [Paenibacillus nasutitermitis]
MSSSYPNASTAASQPGTIYRIRGIVFTALFAALFIAFSFIQIPLWYTAIPITLQTLAVMLAGGLLGASYGFWSIALVVLLTATGLPLLNGHGGLSVLMGATAGFIWMFPFAALLIGWTSDLVFGSGNKLTTKGRIALLLGIIVFGVLFIYASGVLWYAHFAHVSLAKALAACCYPFLTGDTIKTVVAFLLIPILRPLLPRLRASKQK